MYYFLHNHKSSWTFIYFNNSHVGQFVLSSRQLETYTTHLILKRWWKSTCSTWICKVLSTLTKCHQQPNTHIIKNKGHKNTENCTLNLIFQEFFFSCLCLTFVDDDNCSLQWKFYWTIKVEEKWNHNKRWRDTKWNCNNNVSHIQPLFCSVVRWISLQISLFWIELQLVLWKYFQLE